MSRAIALAAVLLSLSPCAAFESTADEPYRADIVQWREDRMAFLRGPRGYLSLVGLFELTHGEHSFGYGDAYDFPLTHRDSTERIGRFDFDGQEVVFLADDKATVRQNGRKITRVDLAADGTGAPTILESGSLRWWAINRGPKLLIRVRDLEAPRMLSFPGFDYFPVDPALRLEATFIPRIGADTIGVLNILGDIIPTKSTGHLQFTIGGHIYRLDVADEGDEFFINFADQTNGDTTYASGRFVYADKPAPGSNTTILDFNKCYNPPCAFSTYTTCPIPPKQNILPIPLNVGEKAVRNGH